MPELQHPAGSDGRRGQVQDAAAAKSATGGAGRPTAVRSSPIHTAPASSEPRFYRYPTMYRAEAPPLLPPGARGFAPFVQQPYVLVSGGIWYWPGATEFKHAAGDGL